MARKDTLAAGARSARFAGGVGDIGVDRNLSKEPRNKISKTAVIKTASKRTFTPLGTTILVRRAVVTKDSRIITPDTVEQEQPAEGTVLSVGVEVVTLDAGQDIVFGKYAGAEFPFNGETLLLMDVSDVKGIVTGGK